jgi:hypothetical protein
VWNNKESLNGIYDWAEFTVPSGSTNYDVEANVTDLFNNILVARKIIISTDKNISIRFNRTTFPLVNLYSALSPIELLDKIDIRNVFISNSSGDNAVVSIWLFI